MRVVSSGTSLNVRFLYFGTPMRQWLSTAVILMCEPVTCSTNLYGPVPTGLRANTSSPLASMYFLGSTMPSVDSDRDRYVGMMSVGSYSTITTRSGAGVSMSWMSARSGPAYPVVERLLIARLMLNFTSSAVMSSPLWNFTPLRRWNVYRLWSAETSHFAASPPFCAG